MNERLDTKAKILNAAEKLFAVKGFETTSLRDITAEAQVNLAAVNYHFQSKDALVDAVIARRVEPVNEKRLALLDAAGANATVEEILTAFLKPVLELNIEAVVPLMGRSLSDPSQFVERRVFKTHLLPLAKRFHEALERALPNAPPAERHWRFHFVLGMLTHVMTWSRVLPVVSGGLCDIADRELLLERLVTFAAAGFRSAIPEASFQEALLEKKG